VGQECGVSECDQTEEAVLTRQDVSACLGITPGCFELPRQRYGVMPEVERSTLRRTTVNLYRRAAIEQLRGKDIVRR